MGLIKRSVLRRGMLPRGIMPSGTSARRVLPWGVLLVVGLGLGPGAASAADGTKHVLLLGQKRDHAPGTHEYMAGLRVLAACLDDVPELELKVLDVSGPWPEGPELIARADCLVLFLGEGGKWMQEDPKRWEAIRRFCARGRGVVGIHWAVGAKDDKYVPGHLAVMGAMHGGSDRKYTYCEATIKPQAAEHPILRGIGQFVLDDEFYYRLKRAEQGKLTPLLSATVDGKPEMCAWAFERVDRGRAFGFVCMHNHVNWGRVECRRLIAQGVLWTLGLPVPEKGLDVEVGPEVLELK